MHVENIEKEDLIFYSGWYNGEIDNISIDLNILK